jgi:hypothetical protein
MSAANQIGTGAVVITANADGLSAGLNAAGSQVEKWAHQTSAKVADHGNAGKSGGGILGGLFGFAKAHPVVTAVAATGAMIAGFAGEAVGTIKELNVEGRKAQSLGVASDRYMGLAAGLKRIGLDGDAVPAVLGRLGKAVAGGSPALEKLGLNAEDLLRLPLDEQFLKVADAIKALPPGAAQAGAAMEIFGRSGYQLLPFLQKGSEGIEHFIAHEKAIGAALGQEDMDKVMRARAALPKIGAAFEGFWNKIVVAAAPVIETVAGGLTKAFEKVSPVLSVVASFVDGAFFVVGEVVTTVIDLVGSFLGDLGDAVGVTMDWKEATTLAGHIGIAVFGAVCVVAAALWDSIKAGAGVVTWVASLTVDQWGLIVDVFKEIIDLAKLLPDELRPDWLDGLAQGVDQFSSKIHGAASDMRAWGEKQVGDVGKGVADTMEWVDGLHEKFDERNKQQVKAHPEAAAAAAAADEGPLKFAAAVLAGSQDIHRITAQSQFGGLVGGDAGDVPKQQLSELRQHGKTLEKIAAALKDDDDAEAI